MGNKRRRLRVDDPDYEDSPDTGKRRPSKYNSSSRARLGSRKSQIKSEPTHIGSFQATAIPISDDEDSVDILKPRSRLRPLPPISDCDEFPRFRHATVFIILDPSNTKYQYILHKDILSRHSALLRDTISRPLRSEYDTELKAKYLNFEVRFQLLRSTRDHCWTLHRRPFTAQQVSGHPQCSTCVTKTRLPDDKVGKLQCSIPATPKTGYSISPRLPALSSNVGTRDTDISIADDCKTEGGKDVPPEILITETTGSRDNKIGENISLLSEVLTTDTTCETARNSDLHSKVPINDMTSDNDCKTQGGGNLISESYIENTSGGSGNKIEESNCLTSGVGVIGMETKKRVPTMKPPSSLCEAYNNMFLIFYDLPHNISTDNIMVALSQCEDLLSLASEFGALPTVRHQIQVHINGYGGRLLNSIKGDPIRWLKISIDLQSIAIFREAVIHTVGTYPSWYQDVSILSSLPPTVQSLIQRKWGDLHRSLDDANSTLLRSTIVIAPGDIPVSLEYKNTFETWIVVQIWRDWLLSRLRTIDANPSAEAAGRLYLLLNCPSDTYLPVEHVRALLEHVRSDSFGSFDNLAEDLEILKSFARNVVRDICVNNSKLNVEEEGIEYLTCTNVSDDEIPWLKPEP